MAKGIDLSAMKTVARSALTNMRKASGAADVDPELQLYKKLKPSDFPALISKYGAEDTIKYITEMEKKLKENGNG